MNGGDNLAALVQDFDERVVFSSRNVAQLGFGNTAKFSGVTTSHSVAVLYNRTPGTAGLSKRLNIWCAESRVSLVPPSEFAAFAFPFEAH
jgi:hypothetical protein